MTPEPSDQQQRLQQRRRTNQDRKQ